MIKLTTSKQLIDQLVVQVDAKSILLLLSQVSADTSLPSHLTAKFKTDGIELEPKHTKRILAYCENELGLIPTTDIAIDKLQAALQELIERKRSRRLAKYRELWSRVPSSNDDPKGGYRLYGGNEIRALNYVEQELLEGDKVVAYVCICLKSLKLINKLPLGMKEMIEDLCSSNS
ncbi:MAG: hypothetical protein NC218_01810 [Acetobacter sp.]|nr:hypothetical protein [Acetobacter sp.]